MANAPPIQGFDADHSSIELLRLKNYTIGRKFADDEILGDECFGKICRSMESLVPFVSLAMFDTNESATALGTCQSQKDKALIRESTTQCS